MMAELPSRRQDVTSTERRPDHSPSGSQGRSEAALSAAAGLHILGRDADRAPPVERRSVARAAVPPRDYSKRIFDLAGALLLAVLLSPFIVVISALIRIEGLPVLFWHKRIGRGGKVFFCLKFRTMALNAEQILRDLLEAHPEMRDEWTQNHKLRDDPRITAVGRFLRKTSLDELPQLLNVIRGEMSLVGPRPVVRAELLRYGRDAASYLAVKPGITGLWQVRGRSDTTYRRRVAMDKYYVRHQNILLDIYILACTVAVVLKRAGAY
jgi:Undecaprenyl-phosphate galactose phosphotransferase WbaP